MAAIFIAITLFFSVLTVSAQPPLAKRTFDEATRLAQAGDFEKAAKSYRAAIAASEGVADEFDVKVRYNLGVCYYRTNQLKAAVKEFHAAIRLSGGRHQRALYALGMTETALENWRAARDAFLKAIEIEPRDGEAWFDLAFVYLAERDYESAALAFRKSIEHKSVDAALGHNNLGVIMAMRFDFDAAAEQFDRAIALSGGRLTAAKGNLEFCRRVIGKKELLAATRFDFARRDARI